MAWRLARLPGTLALAGILCLAAAVDALAANGASGPYDPQLVVPTPVTRPHAWGIDHAVPRRRGVAILSPVESPDSWNPGVGGKHRAVPYYPDYCVHPWHGPRVFVPNNSPNYARRFAGVSVPGGEAGLTPETAGTAGYGGYSGARQDEANLLHLGGFSGPEANHERTLAAPDVIDQIQSGR